MRPIRHSLFFILLVVVCIGAIVFFGRNFIFPKTFCKDCNVILITIDSMNRDHLGLYGYKRNTSPNLDAWSKKAFVFDQYITTADLTPVTQMSLQTGKYPSNNGVVSFSTSLPNNIPTLAEILKEAGYQTVALGSAPEYFAEGVSGWQARRGNFQRGFDKYFDEYFEYQISPNKKPVAVNLPENYLWPAKERGLPVDVLGWLKNAPKSKFFLWIPIGTVHWPYNDEKEFHFADKSYQGIFREDSLRWRTPSQFKRVYENKLWTKDGKQITLTEKDRQFVVDRYDDGIYLTDRFLGELFKITNQRQLERNTIIILTTEHGEEFGEHGYMAHYDIFDPEIRVPLLLYIPKVQTKRIAPQVSTVDILPTILQALGLKSQISLDGKSFLKPLLSKNEFPEDFRPYAFTERTPLMETLMFDSSNIDDKWLVDFIVKDGTAHFRDIGVRTNDWKLIYRESRKIQEEYSWWRRLTKEKTPIAEYELYNLKEKPPEKNNVFKKYPQVGDELKKELNIWLTDTAKQRQQIPADDEETNLNSLLNADQ